MYVILIEWSTGHKTVHMKVYNGVSIYIDGGGSFDQSTADELNELERLEWAGRWPGVGLLNGLSREAGQTEWAENLDMLGG